MSVDADSFDGTCDVWEESTRKARKDRQCDACREMIRVGDRYHVTRSLYDGRWSNTDRCARCETMYRFLSGVMPAGEVCAAELDCGHEWSENFKEPPPLEIAALAFITPAEAQALFAQGGLCERIEADNKRKSEERRFWSRSRHWFTTAHYREFAKHQRDEWEARAKAINKP